MAEAAVEVMDERKQRCFDHRHEKVLRGEAYDDPEGYVRPGLQLEPKVADNAPGACARSAVLPAVPGELERGSVTARVQPCRHPARHHHGSHQTDPKAVRLTISSPY